MKTFLKPLNVEEEKYYLKKMREGSLEAKHILIERNLRLVAHISRKYQNGEEDMEDLISIGTIGLIKAIATFNYERGNRLATYAARCIDNELLMYFRGKRRLRGKCRCMSLSGQTKREIKLILWMWLRAQTEKFLRLLS